MRLGIHCRYRTPRRRSSPAPEAAVVGGWRDHGNTGTGRDLQIIACPCESAAASIGIRPQPHARWGAWTTQSGINRPIADQRNQICGKDRRPRPARPVQGGHVAITSASSALRGLAPGPNRTPTRVRTETRSRTRKFTSAWPMALRDRHREPVASGDAAPRPALGAESGD